jgi:DNA polymerase III epsilon subunit family exonuclease
VVRPPIGNALERLAPQLIVDRSNPAAGIRIVLKDPAGPLKVRPAPTLSVPPGGEEYKQPVRRVALREPKPPAYGADDEIRRLEYVIVDLETTGGAPSRGHRVTEVAAVRMSGDGRILDEYETLVNPDRYIPPFITQLTRITPQMAATAPRFADVAERIHQFIDGAVFVAHNAQFDHRFLGMELGRVGLPLQARTLCTVRLARKTVHEVQSRSLDSLSYFFGVENEARHRAMGDARATALIFRKLLDRLDEQEVVRWEELERFLRRRPRKKKKRVASPQPMEDA